MKHNWEYKPLGDCFCYIKNGANIRQSKDAGGYPITRIETLSNGIFNRDKVGYADITDLSKYNLYVLSDGDLLMSHINSKSYVGRTVKYSAQPNEIFIHGMNLLRLIPHKWINSQYFHYLTKDYYFKSKIANIRKDAVNQSSISISDLRKIPIPVPPMGVQERIVAELDDINAMIEAKREQLKQLDLLAQSVFYTMFGDPVTNPKGWATKKMGELFEIGSGGTPSKEIDEYWDSKDIPWIGSNMCQNRVLYRTDGKYISQRGLENSSAKVLDVGTVLIALVGATIGKVALLQTPTATNQNIGFIKPNTAVAYPMFIFYEVQRLYELFMGVGNGKFKMANLSFIKGLPLILPPLPLQQQFAAKVEAIEAQKAEIEGTIAELQTLLDSRMDYWFN